MRRLVALVAAVTLAVLGMVACRNDGPGEGEARLTVDGEAIVRRADGDSEKVRDEATDVEQGDRVDMVSGTATMVLQGDVRFELREGRGNSGDTRVLMDEVPSLVGGELLVEAPEDVTVEAAKTMFSISDGAVKLSQSYAADAAAYDGSVAIDSAGQLVDLRPLRQVRVSEIGSPEQIKPFDYDQTDPWDRRFLGDAIELGRQLAQLANGYTSSLNPGEGRTVGFFRVVLPGLENEETFTRDLINLDRQPGETLVGAAITDLGERGEFVARWHSVFGFRDQGAEWGLVALDQAVSRGPLLGSLEQALDVSPLAFAESPPSTIGEDSSSPGTTPTTSPPPTQPPTTTPPPTTPPTTPPPIPPPPETPLDPVVDPVAELLGSLVDGLLGVLDPPEP